jgi:cold shock CspA family protein
MKHQGKVVRFGAKGFGFVADSTTRVQFFVHVSDIVDRVDLQEGDRVTFDEGPQIPGKARQAINVELVSGGAQ